jgi:hypothetical protein
VDVHAWLQHRVPGMSIVFGHMVYCQALTAHSKMRCRVSHGFARADRGDTRVHACGHSDEPAVPQRDGGDRVRPFGRYGIAIADGLVTLPMDPYRPKWVTFQQ